MSVDDEGISSSIENRVYNFILSHNLVLSELSLLVAVSGGQDSLCLLNVLYRLKDKLPLKLYVAHLNHGLRAAESIEDAEEVRNFAESLGLPVYVETVDVLSYKKQTRLSLEEAAREIRYAFLARIARLTGCTRVATGHTQDDHIETILMHLIRGSGTQGLIGLRPLSVRKTEEGDIEIIRPLLSITRAETMKYCEANNLPVRYDRSNISHRFLRNRVRLQLVPLLKEFNPRVSESLVRLSALINDELQFIDKEVDRVWGKIVTFKKKTVIFKKSEFSSLDIALKRRLLRKAIELIRSGAVNPLKDIEAEHIEDIIKGLSLPPGRIIQLPYNLYCVIEYEDFLLGDDTAASCPFPPVEEKIGLNIPGEVMVGDYIFTSEIIEGKDASSAGSFTAIFDFERTGDSLYIRKRQAGDRFQPLGMEQFKKVGEFMIDARIPRAWRSRIPLLCSEQDILWVVGYRIDNRFRVTSQTKRVLKVICQIRR